MKVTAFKPLYSRFLAARPEELHFAAHSHHFWPDVSREGQLRAWDDAALHNDRKWEHVFATVVPRTRARIAGLLGFKDPAQIALAPNTHELLVRVFSTLPANRPARVLTSDGEFHSFARQLKRWQEDGVVEAERVPVAPLLADRTAWIEDVRARVGSGKHDVVFLSQVFFNSGLALSAREFAHMFENAPPATRLVVDGYHGFAALPEDWGGLEGRIFYLAGGYKYAQGGEGVGFLVVPKGEWRPTLTGWYAEFARLSGNSPGKVGYSDDGMAFWGATQDPSGWYRFLAVWDQLEALGVTVGDIHRHVRELQKAFLEGLKTAPGLLAAARPVCDLSLLGQGHFLTWEAENQAKASDIRSKLLGRGVYVDQRDSRLRFGFGTYQDLQDVKALLIKLSP